MLMLVARKLEAGMDIIGCLGSGGGYLEDGDEEDVLADLTWVILALSPWLLASSLMVSMMETVCTWALPPFMVPLVFVSSCRHFYERSHFSQVMETSHHRMFSPPIQTYPL